MYSIKQPYRIPTCLVGVEKIRISDLETILSLDDIKDELAIDRDNTAVDPLLTNLREGAFDDVENYLQRSLDENGMVVNYTSIGNDVLLPFAYATTINSVEVDGTALDASDYTVFSGRIQFTNKLGYTGNITISYDAKWQVKRNVLSAIINIVGIDYYRKGTEEKHKEMKMLRADKIAGWI